MLFTRTLQSAAAAACAAFTLLSALPLQASAAEQTTPGGVRFSELPEKIEKIAADGDFASFGCAVFCGDEILYASHFGEIDMENHVAADENTVYEWGSISKTMIWVSVIQLWEQGKIDLNADIRTYLPQNFLRHLSYDDPITMQNLMNHTAGFCETTYALQTMDENAILPLGDALRQSEPAQIWKPGELASYSNWGAALAGYVVECITGMPYSEYVHRNILEPLGMEHTAVTPDHRDNPWVREQREKMNAYTVTPLGKKSMGRQMAFIHLYPAGAVTGTVADLAVYAQALVSKDAPLFREKSTQETMFSGSAFYGESDHDYPSCSCGFWNDFFAVRAVGHNGGTAACSSNMIFDRESGVGYVMMTNGLGDLGSINELLFGKLDKAKLESGNITDHSDLSGTYITSRAPHRGLLRFISRLNTIPLKKTGEDQYSAGPLKITREPKNLLLAEQNGSTVLYGIRTLSDGTTALDLGSMTELPDPFFWFEIGALGLFILMTVTGAILLLVKLIQRIVRKRKHYAGMGMITLAQLAKIVSAAALAAVIALYSINMGIPKQYGMIFGITQAVCGVIFALAALSSFCAMFSKKEKAKAPKYLFNFLFNGIACAVVVYFQMYQFWGC